ncbi:PTS glucose transporter subunit IIA [Carnobacteriaceae bacterium zg-84]|uniref:beta-glucoside-specific PTS transporter subunit IIABC n=1 Tax=Granulicatella sp. zg-84 TaxID=2678503 RepID=UPI0013C24DF5|nr:beta-glucoside-specific PTS transporter subunit IIABC [Granulicatella sp. zg-84]NEW66479.1 PTS beta-glucoside transporter subunit EIIBCA [Granulicatella sp. zg-84]QMI86022.1 PTS glucose transporter subunit IIA [Carnobacteriaceae bacterium zg-84]
MNYKDLAQTILREVGGKENVSSVIHCATRLRFVLVDEQKANTNALKQTPGVVGVVQSGGQYQVIIGSDVANVYRPLVELGGFKEEKEVDTTQPQTIGARLMATISGIFTPVLPVITAAGMIKAVLSLLVVFKLVTTKDQNYQILNFIGDAGFYFLPIFLGGTAARQFKTNQYLGMLMGAFLLHPTFVGLVAATKESGAGIHLFGLPITPVGYSATVIPVILSVLFMSYVERFADKISPKAIKFFSVPLITALVTSVVTFTVLGPIGAIVGQWLGSFFKFLETFGPWVVPTVVGIFSPFLVMTGTHYGLVSIGINNRATIGYDTVVQPGMLASNVSQGGAALAIAFKTKDVNKKALASSAGITAIFGITEPALYGVTLQNKAALIATMISGGIGGFFLGIMNARNFSGGSPGLLTITSYIGENTLYYLYVALAGLVLSVVLSFIITYVLYKEESVEKVSENLQTDRIVSPVKGKVIPLSDVSDATFASGMLGQGVAIIPEESTILSPVNGEIVAIFDTKHAIGLKTVDGIELLIHIGLDTVNLKGEGFKLLAKVGQTVAVGTPLVEVDFDKVDAAGYERVTPILVTNQEAVTSITPTENTSVFAGEELFKINK